MSKKKRRRDIDKEDDEDRDVDNDGDDGGWVVSCEMHCEIWWIRKCGRWDMDIWDVEWNVKSDCKSKKDVPLI